LSLFDKCRQFTRAREVQAAGIYPYFWPISETHATRVTIEGRELVMIGSNNYLGLTEHPQVIEAAQDAIRRFGSGCTGSRFLNGTLDLHVELEEKLAEFAGKEAALTMSTGFQTNSGRSRPSSAATTSSTATARTTRASSTAAASRSAR
jgi:8-amino-7-oxononanoate synthase